MAFYAVMSERTFRVSGNNFFISEFDGGCGFVGRGGLGCPFLFSSRFTLVWRCGVGEYEGAPDMGELTLQR